MISGCPISVVKELPINLPVREIKMNREDTTAAREHINELLAKKAIVHSKHEPGDFCSNIFLVPRKPSGVRCILNLKKFNLFSEKIHFKIETLVTILELVTENCHMTILDLKDAFLGIPIKREHCKYLKFVFDGNVLMYIVLPFRYTGSPRIFTKILRVIASRLRRDGHIVTFYLDDSWQCGRNFKICSKTCQATFKLITSCGFIPNMQKSKLIPSQKIVALGTVIDSVSMTISLPKEKEEGIMELISDVLHSTWFPIRHLAKLIGKLISCTVVCPLGKLYYRDLEKVKIRALNLNLHNYDKKCKLSEPAINELFWWQQNLPNCTSPIFRPNPHVTMTFDACNYGWASCLNSTIANGHFTEKEKDFSINTKETLAIYYGFKSFAHYLTDCHVHLKSDNTTAISFVKNFGGMSSELRLKITRDLWNCAVDQNTWLSISHIPGILNIESDIGSRFLN